MMESIIIVRCLVSRLRNTDVKASFCGVEIAWLTQRNSNIALVQGESTRAVILKRENPSRTPCRAYSNNQLEISACCVEKEASRDYKGCRIFQFTYLVHDYNLDSWRASKLLARDALAPWLWLSSYFYSLYYACHFREMVLPSKSAPQCHTWSQEAESSTVFFFSFSSRIK